MYGEYFKILHSTMQKKGKAAFLKLSFVTHTHTMSDTSNDALKERILNFFTDSGQAQLSLAISL